VIGINHTITISDSDSINTIVINKITIVNNKTMAIIGIAIIKIDITITSPAKMKKVMRWIIIQTERITIKIKNTETVVHIIVDNGRIMVSTTTIVPIETIMDKGVWLIINSKDQTAIRTTINTRLTTILTTTTTIATMIIEATEITTTKIETTTEIHTKTSQINLIANRNNAKFKNCKKYLSKITVRKVNFLIDLDEKTI